MNSATEHTMVGYSNKPHVGQLVVLMMAHGVRKVVACPGSRNAVILHNMVRSGAFELYPVVDERSAAFVALGMSQATGDSVAVCVTSGTALLNLLPAVCEAYYQGAQLLIISADRPSEAIDQLEGQTIHQFGALQPYAEAYQLIEYNTAEYRDFCNRMLNEALCKLQYGPVHINVPICEPLFTFDVDSLPIERKFIMSHSHNLETDALEMARCWVKKAKMPMLVVGQLSPEEATVFHQYPQLTRSFLVYAEVVSNVPVTIHPHTIERWLAESRHCLPDVVIHLGRNQVNRNLKKYLRNLPQLKVIRIESQENFVPDTFGGLSLLLRTDDVGNTLRQICEQRQSNFAEETLLDESQKHVSKPWSAPTDPLSDLQTMHYVLQHLKPLPHVAIHLGNSSSVRNANLCMMDIVHPVYCNRGTNGIEGSLSVAVGHALARPQQMVCVFIGDLSFFYDVNALWGHEQLGNLRIVLFNNRGGQIFHQLPGLGLSPAFTPFISGRNEATAVGIAASYGVEHHEAYNSATLVAGVQALLRPQSSRPILLEVFTSADHNLEAVRRWTQAEE